MSRWKPVKQPVFGSSGKQCVRCGQWFLWANYYRKGGGYRDVCTRCLSKSPADDELPREGYERGTERLGGADR